MIITIGREYGSGGHEIGKLLARNYGIQFYDKSALVHLAKANGYYDEIVSFYEEKPVNSLIYAIAMNSYSEDPGKKQFEIIKKIVQQESCVIIGRCGNYIFKGNEDLTSVFIHADISKRMQRVTDIYQVNAKDMKTLIENTDKKRAAFHHFYTNENWGASENYQLTIDSGKIGIEASVELIAHYIEMKQKNNWI